MDYPKTWDALLQVKTKKTGFNCLNKMIFLAKMLYIPLGFMRKKLVANISKKLRSQNVHFPIDRFFIKLENKKDKFISEIVDHPEMGVKTNFIQRLNQVPVSTVNFSHSINLNLRRANLVLSFFSFVIWGMVGSWCHSVVRFTQFLTCLVKVALKFF